MNTKRFFAMIGRTEIAGLIGPNGAGKTTIFNLLTNVYTPTRGSILLDGVDTRGLKTWQLNKLGVARTFQNIRLFRDLTVEENVLIGLHNEMTYSLASAMVLICRSTSATRPMPVVLTSTVPKVVFFLAPPAALCARSRRASRSRRLIISPSEVS